MAVTQASPITVELNFTRSTKGTHVFTATEATAAVMTLYVTKAALAAPPPKITVTIAPAAE
jgi:hypothetical protein